jgi:hypothetical protein
LGDGSTLLDNKETDALLKIADVPEAAAGGPLLLWRERRMQSIATVVFYAQRQVQQVALDPPAPGTALDRYMFNPVTFQKAVVYQPRLILLDKSLIRRIPSNLLYTPVRSSTTVELGMIVCSPR